MAKSYLDGSLRAARRIFGVHVGHRVTWFNKCVGGKLSGNRPGSRSQVKSNLATAARSCQGNRGRKWEARTPPVELYT